MTNVWGLKSEPTCEWVLMGNPDCNTWPAQTERAKTLWGPVKEWKSWWKETERKVEKFPGIC